MKLIPAMARRMIGRVLTALKSDPVPCWTEYLRQTR